MESITDRMAAIRQRAGLTNSPASNGAWSAEERMATYNSREGNLEGYDCQKCRNKGFLFETQNGYEYTVECECMDIRRAMARLENSGLADVIDMYQLDKFTTKTIHHKNMKAMAEAFLTEETGWFFVGGQVGAGKTHICTAICGELLKRGKSVRYIIWPEEVTKLKAVKTDDEEYARLMNDLKKNTVLYIDDFFKKQEGTLPTSADVDIAFELLNYMYLQKEKRVIISSERTVREITEQIDQGLGSRIYQKCGNYRISITKDTRKNYRLQNEE